MDTKEQFQPRVGVGGHIPVDDKIFYISENADGTLSGTEPMSVTQYRDALKAAAEERGIDRSVRSVANTNASIRYRINQGYLNGNNKHGFMLVNEVAGSRPIGNRQKGV